MRWGWVSIFAALLGCVAACSSSGVVLETRRGDPSPTDGGAGAVSTMDDAGPPKGVDSDLLRSGSRIHVQVEVADGDFLGVQGLYDTLHDVPCSINLTDDGVARCLPETPGLGNVLFLDPDCTQPVVLATPEGSPCYGPAEPPPYVEWVSPNPNPCSKSTTDAWYVVTPGPQIQPPAQLYNFLNPDDTCQPTTATGNTLNGAMPSFYAANPSPASDWVAFQKTVKPLTSRLGVSQWIGSDGSRTVGDMVLLSNDEPCLPNGRYSVSNPDTAYRCIPENAQDITGGDYFSDAACTTTVAVASSCGLPEVLVEGSSSNDPCSMSGEVSLFSIGNVVPSSTLYSTFDPMSGPGPCSAAASQLVGMVAYAKGAPVDPAIYPPMQMVLAGSGRIRHYEWQSEGVSIGTMGLSGVSVPITVGSYGISGEWVDATTGALITPGFFADGVVRGTFSTTESDKFFADANCKTWILDQPTSPDVCPTPGMLRWVTFDGTPPPSARCDDPRTFQSSVRPILGKHTGKVYTLNPDINVEMNGGCSEYVPSKGSVSYDFYDLGNSIPASSLFAEIKSVDL